MNDKKDQKWPIIGHGNIVNYLQNSLAKKRLVHAYLFSGPLSVGKSMVADYFVRSLLCLDAGDGSSDCQCQSCQQYKRNIHPDYFGLKLPSDKKNISIEQIREWQLALSRKPSLGQHKVGLIEGVENLSIEASNALLKTVEEPSANTIIILLTHDSNLLLPTIISRSQIIKFKKVNDRAISHFLDQQGIEHSEVNLITQLAQGLPGRAISYFKSNELLAEKKQVIEDAIGLFQKPLDQRWSFLEEYLKGYEGVAKSKQAQIIVDDLLLIYREIYLMKNNNTDCQYLSHWQDNLRGIVEQYSWQKLLLIGDKIFYIKNKWLYNPNPRLMVEDLLLTL